MRMLDLFTGIGGFSLAASWVWGNELDLAGFCEQDAYCGKVLKKNFPDVPIYPDIKELRGEWFQDIDLITGGFPCQDISVAGKGAGIDGDRSGLWSELCRVISEVRPRYALIENVPMLIHRGLERVLCDLTEIGYDAEWQVIGADDVGARHKRKRIWIVAYPNSDGTKRDQPSNGQRSGIMENGDTSRETMAHTQHAGRPETEIAGQDHGIQPAIASGQELCLDELEGTSGLRSPGDMAHTQSEGRECGSTGKQGIDSQCRTGLSGRHDTGTVPHTDERIGDIWTVEPDVGRVANGIPKRVDRLRGLGNAIVPQIAALIMQMIKDDMNL